MSRLDIPEGQLRFGVEILTGPFCLFILEMFSIINMSYLNNKAKGRDCMLKKFRSKEFLMGIVFTLVLVSAVNVFASGPIKKQIDVVYNNIKLVVDGKPVSFGKDSAGNRIEPLIHNGTTYLPIRSVGEAIGKRVDWDGTTQTVYLGEKPGEISFMTETIKPYNYSGHGFRIYELKSSDKLSIAGKEYTTGYLAQHSNSVSAGSRATLGTASAKFNLDSKYKTLTFDLGPSTKYSSTDAKFNLYLDDKLYETYEVSENGSIKNIVINVQGVNQLRFEFSSVAGTGIGIGNPTIK